MNEDEHLVRIYRFSDFGVHAQSYEGKRARKIETVKGCLDLKRYRVLSVNTWVKRGFMLALLLLAAVSLASFGWVNAASSPPPGIKDGAYMWYKLEDFNTNKTDYMYVEFVEVHEDTAEMLIRTGLLSLNESEWSQRPPLYGYLDFETGDLTLAGATGGVGVSFWTNPSAHRNATSGFPLDNKGYYQVDCLVLESEKHEERSWYDKITGVLIQTSFLSDDLTTRIVILYETSVPVGKGATNQWVLPFETPADTMTYAAVLIGSVAVIAVATIGLVRFRRRRRASQGVLGKRCPSCGLKNKDDAVFCSRCGSSLAATGASVPTPEPPVSAAPVMKPELSVSVVPVTKPEPPVSMVAAPRELGRTIAGPVETRNVCRTCGHVNPDWIRQYCVRCAAEMKID